MKENQIKAIFITLFTPIFSGIGILAVPVLLLVLSNVIDYGTGLVAAKYRSEKINSYKSFRGIAKKVCMWLLVCVGVLVDAFLISYGGKVGLQVPSLFLIACFVASWLFINEVISILENMVDIGVKMPPFLMPLVKNIKTKVEAQAEAEVAGLTEKKEE